jgi:hypothetical protein
MGKNNNLTSIANSLAITILHELVLEHTNKPESKTHLQKEYIEYRGQSIKKINRQKLNEKDKALLKEKIISKIQNKLNIKYPDIKIPSKEITKKINESLLYLFD